MAWVPFGKSHSKYTQLALLDLNLRSTLTNLIRSHLVLTLLYLINCTISPHNFTLLQTNLNSYFDPPHHISTSPSFTISPLLNFTLLVLISFYFTTSITLFRCPQLFERRASGSSGTFGSFGRSDEKGEKNQRIFLTKVCYALPFQNTNFILITGEGIMFDCKCRLRIRFF
jgi:hypothetical protein